jgi:hypothetical protein
MANNVQGLAESALIVFGGFVSETNPPDIPAGSAVVATDVDYTVASVRTRDGLENVYTYTGYCQSKAAACGASAANGPNETSWSDPGNIASNTPGTYSSVNSIVVSNDPRILAVTLSSDWSVVGSTATITLTSSHAGPLTLVLTFGIYVVSTGTIASITDSLGSSWRRFVGPLTFERQVVFPPPTTRPGIFEAWTVLLPGGQPNPYSITVNFNASIQGQDYNIDITPYVYCTGVDAVATAVPVGETNPTGASLTTTAQRVVVGTMVVGHTSANPSGTVLSVFESGFPNTMLATYGTNTFNVLSPAGTYNPAWATSDTEPLDSNSLATFSIIPGSLSTWSGSSDVLQARCLGFTIPLTSSVLGITVTVNGKQSVSDPGAYLELSLLDSTEPTRIFTLPLTDGSVTFGPDLWDQIWNPAQINNNGFGFGIQAFASPGLDVVFDISGVVVNVCFSPPCKFDYIKTFEMTDGEVLTLALDKCGVFWQEDVENNPNVLTPFYTTIEPNTFARSVTQDDREFIALSDLSMGTDMPRAYNGQWVDRLSQVGPGASPSFNATANTFDIASITQPPAVTNAGTFAPFRAVLWSSGVGIKHTAGNIFSLYYSFHTSPPDPNVVVGNYVYLVNFATTGGASPDGTYQIIDAGVIAGGPGGPCNYFSVQVPSSQNAYYQPGAGPSYNITMATITLAAPDATVQVGAQIAISGATPSTWDDTWTILAALNAAQLTITATSLSLGVATYNFTIISGVAPTVGQQVTITGTTNGGGIFNVTNGIVNAASPTSFSLLIDAPDVLPAAEANGQAIVNGTIFQFDVGPKYAGTPTDPILGNDTGTGTVVQAGQLGAGTRMGTVMFLTRNGFLTAPAPPATFTLNEGANAIVVTNIPIGPPNVIARVIALTGANGAFFFWIPVPVIVMNSGQAITYSSTVIQDNVTTQVTLNLTDAVLLAALSIDSQGSNNFAEVELGSCIGVTSYASRLFAWGEQNKIQNLLNWSFDGGYLAANQQSNLVPLGWTVDQTSGAGGSLVVSPLFGDSYYILNASGSTQALYGMIWQTAFQDYNQVPIITPQTEYNVRVTASSPSGAASGNLVIDLFSPSFGVVYGSYSLPLASLTTSMKIFTGTLLTTAFTTQVPDDLQLRVYASQIPDGADVEIDRLEPFNTAQPTLTTNLRGSYVNNFEAFDGVTGNLGAGSQNQQPVRNTFSLFDNLYIVKTKSFYSTSDNGTTEPNFWNVREVSNKVGTPSIYGVDVGEGWALVVGQAGLYIFTGGDPIKISPELDGNPGVWQSINWRYGNTIWIRNDTNNRKIYIGVPIATPNFWMPSFPVNANPTQPNVVLMCNYKELMTSGALANEAPIRLTYTGELKTYSLGRKWAAWSIEACYADFITRPDTTEPLFFCSTTSPKIYQQITGNYADDGAAMRCDYITYPFPKTREAQELQMGMHQLLAHFMTTLTIGNGNLRMIVYPDSIESPNQEALYPEPLFDPPAEGDIEIPLNIEGNRFFVGLSVKDANEWFETSKIVMALGTNPWAPLRGS